MKLRMVAATALLGVLGVLGSTSVADAYEIKHSAEGEPVRWREETVRWTLDRSMEEVPGGLAAARDAADAWSAQHGAPTLETGGAEGRAPLTLGFDGACGVFFAAGGHAAAGKALAVTVLSFDDRTGSILDADIVVNGAYRFAAPPGAAAGSTGSTAASSPPAPSYDVGRVLAHEMGHALGLSDEPGREDALMYPYVQPSLAMDAAPASDDLAGLRTLYESSTGGDAAGGCAVMARSPAKAPRTALAAVALAAALFSLVSFARARDGRRARRRAASGVVFAAAALALPPDLTAAAPASPSAAPQALQAGLTPAAIHEADQLRGAHRAAGEADAAAVVTRVSTVSEGGLFRTVLELACDTTTAASRAGSATSGIRCPPRSRAAMWGGTIGGVRQELAASRVPALGDHVLVAFDAPPAADRLGAVRLPLSSAPGSREAAARVVRLVTAAPSGGTQR